MFVEPYFLRSNVDSVSWRSDSAEDRFVMEDERSRRRSEVEVSISSRWGSVRVPCACFSCPFWCGWDCFVLETEDVRRSCWRCDGGGAFVVVR